eukprot:4593009-Pyramimonas_sp.AAC.1
MSKTSLFGGPVEAPRSTGVSVRGPRQPPGTGATEGNITPPHPSCSSCCSLSWQAPSPPGPCAAP